MDFLFPIDLNLLRGDHVPAHIGDVLPKLRITDPHPGDTVTAEDEDGATYWAVIESIDSNGWVDLRLKLETRLRRDGSFDEPEAVVRPPFTGFRSEPTTVGGGPA